VQKTVIVNAEAMKLWDCDGANALGPFGSIDLLKRNGLQFFFALSILASDTFCVGFHFIFLSSSARARPGGGWPWGRLCLATVIEREVFPDLQRSLLRQICRGASLKLCGAAGFAIPHHPRVLHRAFANDETGRSAVGHFVFILSPSWTNCRIASDMFGTGFCFARHFSMAPIISSVKPITFLIG
jgi:hypothetical protein